MKNSVLANSLIHHCTQIPNKKQLKGGRALLGSPVRTIVHTDHEAQEKPGLAAKLAFLFCFVFSLVDGAAHTAVGRMMNSFTPHKEPSQTHPVVF